VEERRGEGSVLICSDCSYPYFQFVLVRYRTGETFVLGLSFIPSEIPFLI
jgi:hypothetical protein